MKIILVFMFMILSATIISTPCANLTQGVDNEFNRQLNKSLSIKNLSGDDFMNNVRIKIITKRDDLNREQIEKLKKLPDLSIQLENIIRYNLSTESLSTKDENNIEYIKAIAHEASEKYNIDYSFIMAVIDQESKFNRFAKSPVGAKGLMQLMDPTAKELGVKNVFNIRDNIMGGTKYLYQLKKQFNTKELILAAYNGGMGNVRKYNGVPPFKETQIYVRVVQKKENKYKGI